MYLGLYNDEMAAARVFDRCRIVSEKPNVRDPACLSDFQTKINFDIKVRGPSHPSDPLERAVSYR